MQKDRGSSSVFQLLSLGGSSQIQQFSLVLPSGSGSEGRVSPNTQISFLNQSKIFYDSSALTFRFASVLSLGTPTRWSDFDRYLSSRLHQYGALLVDSPISTPEICENVYQCQSEGHILQELKVIYHTRQFFISYNGRCIELLPIKAILQVTFRINKTSGWGYPKCMSQGQR